MLLALSDLVLAGTLVANACAITQHNQHCPRLHTPQNQSHEHLNNRLTLHPNSQRCSPQLQAPSAIW